MTPLLSIAAYGCLLCFVLGCIRRVRQYARAPKHLRWELYPVPHEAAHRRSHGGSRFEESDWWMHPPGNSRLAALRAMLEEIVTLRIVRRANWNLWWRSQLFHSGIYCLTLAVIVLLATDVAGASSAVSGAVVWFARVGLLLMFIGSCALLWKRMSDPDLTNSTHSMDFIQLGTIALGTALIFMGTLSASVPSARVLIRALATGEQIQVPPALALGLLLAFALVAYIPYSPMAHFIGKYFSFHQVLWDDEPIQDTKLTRSFAENLRFSPTWSAPHILGDGKRTWADIAGENPATTQGAGK